MAVLITRIKDLQVTQCAPLQQCSFLLAEGFDGPIDLSRRFAQSGGAELTSYPQKFMRLSTSWYPSFISAASEESGISVQG